MADTTPLLASLLMGQRQDYNNPFADQRKFGRELIIKGSSTAPLQGGGWLEGLSRALQGGIGGYFEGQANRDELAQQKSNVDVYSRAAAERDPQKAALILKGLQGGDPQQAALFGQIIQNNINEGLKQQQAQGTYERSGAVAPPTQQPNATPPQPSYAAGGTPTGLDNNVMNIRASNAPFADKGAPQNGFETFQTPQAGANATVDNFKAYVQQNPNITVAQAIAKWAPPSENNTNGYISRVAETSGINPGQPLAQVMQNPVDMARLMEAAIPVEKGKIPAGVTPDVLVNAGARGQQMAQAQPQGQGVAPTPQQIGQLPPSPPAAQYRAQEQQFARQGDYVQANAYRQKALEEDAKWAAGLQQEQAKIGMQGAEHDRQQNTATLNTEQAKAASFADKMLMANNVINNLENVGTSGKGKLLESAGTLGNYGQTPSYRQYATAKEAFINSQLRLESGSAIGKDEFVRAEHQYFPQPGDDAQTIAQKAEQRRAAVEGMVRSAGPTYKPGSGAPSAAPSQSGGNALLDQAREAIKQGKPRDAVIEVLKAHGGDPSQL